MYSINEYFEIWANQVFPCGCPDYILERFRASYLAGAGAMLKMNHDLRHSSMTPDAQEQVLLGLRDELLTWAKTTEPDP